jgi:hypothetical protein
MSGPSAGLPLRIAPSTPTLALRLSFATVAFLQEAERRNPKGDMPWTKKQREIPDYLSAHQRPRLRPELLEETRDEGYARWRPCTSTSNLERKGGSAALQRAAARGRSGAPAGRDRAALLGLVAAGFIEAPETPDRSVVPEEMSPAAGKSRPQGAAVHDHSDPGRRLHRGPRPERPQRETVVALVGGTHATVKRLYRGRTAASGFSPRNHGAIIAGRRRAGPGRWWRFRKTS